LGSRAPKATPKGARRDLEKLRFLCERWSGAKHGEQVSIGWAMTEPTRYLIADQFRFDVPTRELLPLEDASDQKPVPLGSRAADLLLLFLQRPGELVSKKEIMDAVWPNTVVEESNLPVQIAAVRRALESHPDGGNAILTVPGRGYRFTLPVRPEAEPAGTPLAIVASPSRVALAEPPAEAVVLAPMHHAVSRTRRVLWIGLPVGAVVVAALVAFWLARHESNSPFPPPLYKFDASVVPLVTDRARIDLQRYLSQPDFKALAISSDAYAVAVSGRDAQAAASEALERCKTRSRPTAYCRLYAVGDGVVWSPGSLPLPLRFDIRTEPLDQAFTVEDLPSSWASRSEVINKAYMTNPDHRALALSMANQTAGGYFTLSGAPSREPLVRLTNERCADYFVSPCLIVSIDGFWTVRVPKTRRLLGLFMLTNEAAMSEAEKESVGQIYQQADWRALARGKSGRWYPVGAAPSEASAVERALALCAEHDADCSIYAISNFRVADDK
jgi:DNA-binding winged helix-turn-helix (wHTH) protein